MECNKEEAFRAKSIAERKIEDKNFTAAKKFALKAKQLYPDVDISRLICVCDVHCSSEIKVFGNELDWYNILQIEPGANEAMIKKQYRKLAFMLHPDKNNIPGAEAAFKLVGEAQRMLLDKEKRSIYDLKYKHLYRSALTKCASQQANENCNGPKQNVAQNNSSISPSHQEVKEMAESGVAIGKETFWTVCPFCGVHYKYFKGVLFKTISCQSCEKLYIAHDVHNVGVTDANQKSRGEVDKMEHVIKLSESSESDSNMDVRGVDINCEASRAPPPGRSVGIKRNGIYNESGGEMGVNLGKKAKSSGLRSPVFEKHSDASGTDQQTSHSWHKQETKGVSNKSDGEETVGVPFKKNFGSEATPEANSHYYPDPEFYDFDKDRVEKCFKVGQVWAAYDTFDAMPRLYARIRKILSPWFKVRVTWLDPDPDDEHGMKWADEELPFSCGKFKNGPSQCTDDRLIFSHLVSWEKGNGRNSVIVYPKTGQIWALFKNWVPNIAHSDLYNSEYDIVQVVHTNHQHFKVLVLEPVQAFKAVFKPLKNGRSTVTKEICRSELLRFSHRIPSFRLTGERGGRFRGFWELDSAALPDRKK